MPFRELPNEVESEWEKRTGKPWWKPPRPEDKPDEPEVLLRQVGPNLFQLLDDFAYALPERDREAGQEWEWNVPAHELDLAPDTPGKDNATDLASVPAWLWWFIASQRRLPSPRS